MSLLRTLRVAAPAAAGTALRRARSGPLRPGWSLPFEVLVAACRRVSGSASLGLQDRRALFEAMPASPRVLARVTRTPVEAGGVPAVWVEPRGSSSGPVVLYLHGGGYVLGSSHAYREVTARLAADSGARLLVPDYRLAPEHPYPAALEDALAAHDWLLRQGVGPERLVVAGDSAGGGLGLQLLLALREGSAPLPAGAVLLSPWVDLACAARSHVELAPYDYLSREVLRDWGRAYAGSLPLEEARVSPLRARLHGLPPLFLQVGGVELLRDAVVELAERARAAGVEVTLDVCAELPHVPSALGALHPEGRAAHARVAEALGRAATHGARMRAASVRSPG